MKKMSLEIVSKKESPKIEDYRYITVNSFTDDTVNEFYKKIIELSSNDEVKIIPVLINSYGGSVHNLLAMIDIIKSANKPVATIGVGKVMSAGTVLLASGTPGYRYVAQNADIMIHEVSSMSWGKNTELQNDAKNTKKLNTKLLEMLSKFCKKDNNFFKSKLKKYSNVDWFISAKNCKDLGLVDHIGVPNFIIK